MATITEALIAHLKADANVAAIVGARVMADLIPERRNKDKTEPDLPAVVVEAPNENAEYSCDGDDRLPRAKLVLHAVSRQRSEARALGDALATAADGFRGTQSGITVQATFVDDEVDDLVESEENPGLRAYTRSILCESVYERDR